MSRCIQLKNLNGMLTLGRKSIYDLVLSLNDMSSKINRVIFLLANAGILVALYLLWTYVTSTHIACTDQGCDLVRASSFSHLFGVPLPFFGVIFYIMVIFFAYLIGVGKNPFKIRSEILLFVTAGFGFIYSVYLTFLEAFVIHAFCDWCLVSAIISTLIFAFSWGEVCYEKYFKKR